MIIVMHSTATDAEVEAVTALIASARLTSHVSRGSERTIVGVIGISEDKETLLGQFAELAGVESVVPISKSYKLVSREGRDERNPALASAWTARFAANHSISALAT